MTFKTFVTSVAVAATLLGPVFAFADESPVVVTDQIVVVAPTPVIDMTTELADLKAREADPSTGFVTRFFLRIKIKELENKLNIATALK